MKNGKINKLVADKHLYVVIKIEENRMFWGMLTSNFGSTHQAKICSPCEKEREYFTIFIQIEHSAFDSFQRHKNHAG